MKAKRKLGLGIKKKKVAFRQGVVTKARDALKKLKVDDIKEGAEIALAAAKHAVKQIGGKKKIRTPRVIPIPKTGGILPLIPAILAGISAIGGLSGGAASIAKAVNDVKAAKKQLEEAKRHNQTMEAIALGRKGSGLYLKPYRSGLGLYLKQSKNF